MNIRLYTRNKALENAISNTVAGLNLGTFYIERPAWMERPRKATFVVTRRKLSPEVERYGATLGAMVLVAPEALEWLADQLVKRAELGLAETVLVGGDYAEPNRNGE